MTFSTKRDIHANRALRAHEAVVDTVVPRPRASHKSGGAGSGRLFVKRGKTLLTMLLPERHLPSVCSKRYNAACVFRVVGESLVHREWRRKSVDTSYPSCGLGMESASTRGHGMPSQTG